MPKRLRYALILAVIFTCLLPGFQTIGKDEEEIIKKARKVEKIVAELRELEPKEPVKVGVRTRDEVKQYIIDIFEKEFSEEELSEINKVLAKLGLIPRDMDLKKFYSEMLSEAVAGYYDYEKNQLFIVKRKPGEKPTATEKAIEDQFKTLETLTGRGYEDFVMAHEITHAIQDQHFGIDTLPIDLEFNEDAILAAKSVFEGDASIVMYDYLLQPIGMDSSMIPKGMLTIDAAMGGTTPTLEKAPEYIRRGVVFPYVDGFKFAMAVKEEGGWEAINQLYKDPPLSTEQIIHPSKFLKERDYPTLIDIPILREMLGNQWKLLHTDCLGQANIHALIKEFYKKSKPKIISRVASGWDGDRYWAFENSNDGRLLLIWYLYWDSEKDSREFFKTYKKLASKKYEDYHPVEETETKALASTEEDSVLIEMRGRNVLVIEGFRDEDNLDFNRIWDSVVKDEVTNAKELKAFEEKYKEATGKQVPETAPEEAIVGKLRMRVPQGWTMSKSNGRIEALSQTTSGVVIVQTEPRRGLSAEKFLQRELDRFTQALEFSLLHPSVERMETKNLVFYVHAFIGAARELGPEEVTFRLAVAEANDVLVIVTCAAAQHDAEKLRDDFEYILKSLDVE